MVVMKKNEVVVIQNGKRMEFPSAEDGEAFLEAKIFPVLRRTRMPGGPRWGYSFSDVDP